jgi:hypothetical protein
VRYKAFSSSEKVCAYADQLENIIAENTIPLSSNEYIIIYPYITLTISADIIIYIF